ncbi:DUF808 family protein [Aeromicrobium sp. 636]|uniref:DUF808 domain-containing protein n=1 Tax=Aeromicrobium senzhongii TaxID=2663859 RepID=A0A8I0K1I2_9ACTN|nr:MULTISPECIES: DUF808 domain-containing protein [Aeromicrobium]MBC9226928.1 DUF808 domain-containing protein [Aeromicrobium senzhongii]MCQ3999028.1 DUF808 family protein [Aeromicrobium sp. 636]MTB89465.1 DUF808 family protein [Aeromicrobium senzhongii]QNL94398.1 DUF808 domain-containing protein [Aeromicrobium senzhongii]
MAGGLVALLDDVAALARIAAASIDDVAAGAGKASIKAAGVVVDDAAVTPRYVHGVDPKRELSIIARIAKGSLRNKLLFILPALLVLSQFLPWVLTPVLMLGGAYLCFEGAEKIWHVLHPHHEKVEEPASAQGPEAEDQVVKSAITTDFILSTEIMVISLNEVADESFWSRAIILAVVALGITALVYGVVALIVRMDDVGVGLAQRTSTLAQRTGKLLVKAMPKVLSALSVIGIAAMLWVGGHILLVGTDDLGWHWLYGKVHDLEHWIADVMPVADGAFEWVGNTAASAVLGLVVGAVVVALVTGVKRLRRH